jgi:uncharacterized protein
LRISPTTARSVSSLVSTIAAVVLLALPAVAAESVDGAKASPTAELYRAQTIVTGTGEANRSTGFASCLEDVLIKVSGLLQLAGDPRLAPYKADAERLVRDFSYRDEKGGKPKNDEQGTRDRSFVLTVDFDEAAVNGVLAGLGVTSWLSRRPVLGIFVELQFAARRYVVAGDSKETDLQRDSLLAAATRRGMSVVLPDAATLARLGANDLALAGIAREKLTEAAAARGGEALLTARLVWDDQALQWQAEWQLDWQDGAHQARSRHWQLAAVTFDENFRQGIGAAAQILSQPP